MPWLGCAILGLAYALLAAATLTGTRPVGLLLILLALGGLGLGTSFSAMLVHLTRAATPRYAAGTPRQPCRHPHGLLADGSGAACRVMRHPHGGNPGASMASRSKRNTTGQRCR